MQACITRISAAAGPGGFAEARRRESAQRMDMQRREASQREVREGALVGDGVERVTGALQLSRALSLLGQAGAKREPGTAQGTAHSATEATSPRTRLRIALSAPPVSGRLADGRSRQRSTCE